MNAQADVSEANFNSFIGTGTIELWGPTHAKQPEWKFASSDLRALYKNQAGEYTVTDLGRPYVSLSSDQGYIKIKNTANSNGTWSLEYTQTASEAHRFKVVAGSAKNQTDGFVSLISESAEHAGRNYLKAERSYLAMNGPSGGDTCWKLNKKAVALPKHFKLHAYSIGGQRTNTNSYWIGWDKGNMAGVIIKDATDANRPFMEIEKIDLGADMFAFKVTNAGQNQYLAVGTGELVSVTKFSSIDALPNAAKFYSRQPLATENEAMDLNYRSFESVQIPGSYLRHTGYVLYVHPKKTDKVYIEDASWLLEETK